MREEEKEIKAFVEEHEIKERRHKYKVVGIVGPMFAGKTTELIRHISTWEKAGKTVKYFKPIKDTRHKGELVRSHGGLEIEAEAVEQLPVSLKGVDVVGVEELHMFKFPLEVLWVWAKMGIRVYYTAITVSHKLLPMENILKWQVYTTKAIILYSRCSECGTKTSLTKLLVKTDKEIVVGGKELYEPRCMLCWEL